MADAILSISESAKNGTPVLSLKGELDAHTVPLLKSAIDKIIASGAVKIVFDFTALTYISSAGIGVLNAALSSLKTKGGKISIGGVNKTIQDTLEVMYFTKKADVFLTIEEALKSV